MDAFPLDWPVGYKRTESYKRRGSQFKQTMENAQKFLRQEVARLGGTGLIVSTNIPVRNDGGLYADWMKKKIDDPGVAIFFRYKGQDITMCADQYSRIWENIYALGKTIESIRAIERYGASEFMQRAFSGFTALPESSVIITPQKWWQVLEVSPTASEDEIKSAYRKKAIETHPGKGGTAEQFVIIQNAYQEGLNKTT